MKGSGQGNSGSGRTKRARNNEPVTAMLTQPDCQGSFDIAVKNGDLAVVRELLSDPRVDPAAHDDYAICMAAQNGHTEIVELLLADNGTNSEISLGEKIAKQMLGFLTTAFLR